jgi:hypothetical protein
MSLKRNSGVVVWTWAAGVFLFMGGALGCTAYPTLKDMPLDCSADSGYELQTIDNYEMVGAANLWDSGDTTTANVSVAVESLTDGTRCGSTAALVIRSVHNNDWGSLFGFNNFGPRDESAYEGLSFWARAPGNTTKGFTMLLDDPNTASSTAVTSNCKLYQTADGGTGGPTMTVYDPSTGMAISGSTTAAPPPDACGNSYSVVAVLTTDWRFYTFPFATFLQTAMPNRVPNSSLSQTGGLTERGY